jgi:hypothetical protein
MPYGVSNALHRVDIIHTAKGEEVQRMFREFDTPEEARAELTRMYREDGAEELGVCGETDLVTMYLYRDGVSTDCRIAEFG